MLLRFEVSNHRSIFQPVELSMIAVDEDRAATRSFDLLAEHVLTIAGIYGPNASGKSNVIEALTWLSVAASQSLRSWDKIIPREPFKFKPGPTTSSVYEVEMIANGVRYSYRLEVDDSTVLFEGLYSYPEKRRRILFEREGLDINFRRGLGDLAGTRDLLTPSTLALSAAMRLNESEIRSFGRQLAGIQTIGLPRGAEWNRFGLAAERGTPTIRLFDERYPGQATLFDEIDSGPLGTRRNALAMLRFADLGIDNVRIVESEDNDARISPQVRRQPRRRAQLMHKVANQEIPFELSEESTGTRTWFTLIGPTLSALSDGRTVLIDEIDANLHPRLSARLLELFEDPQTNPHGAQLIFTSHDTSLLNVLNRDEVWLTDKDETGSTSTALAEFGGDRVRRSLNLEKAYLQGRFGAVPELDQLMLRRALGLTRDPSND